MLPDKLRAAAEVSTVVPIEYVGGYTLGIAGITTDVTVTFGGNLTGGLASSASEGDIVLVWFGTGSLADRNLVVAGYTEITELYSDDTYDTNLVVAYKFMGVTPDSTFVLTGGTLSFDDAGAVVVQVFRNVDLQSPFNTAATTATAGGSVLANPPAITPYPASKALVIAGGAGAHTDGNPTYSSSSLTNFRSVGRNGTYDVTIGAGYFTWASGTYDPAQFTFSGTTFSTNSWAAATLALQPVLTTTLPTFIASQVGFDGTAGTTLVINKPTGTLEGDLMVAVMGCTGTSTKDWTGATGWTEAADQGGGAPYLRVAYKVAGASEPSSYTFTVSVSAGLRAGAILTYRNAAYDAIGAFDTGSTIDIIGPSAAVPGCVLIAAAMTEDSQTITGPSGMTTRASRSSTVSFSLVDKYVGYGATGTFSFSVPGDASKAGIALTIKPA